jgi:glycosyltransferase involved in cell wall biosynthesis
MPSICFLAHNALGSLAGHNLQHAGGIERQQALMAEWLANNGWRVSMVTWDDRIDEPDVINGVRVVTMCGRNDGLRGLRFFHPRWTSLRTALLSADADIYYYNCGDLGLGQLALWAKQHERPVVYSVSSDPDCDPQLPTLHSIREKLLYRHGLQNCRHVIVQSERQQTMLRDGFALDSTLLAMPSKGFLQATKRRRDASDRSPFHVLWVGRISSEKRPDWIVEVARQLPDVQFTIVGASNKETEYAKSVQDDAAQLKNVTMVGRVPFERMADFYPTTDLLCCTSVYEGFPNVFLEAWSVGVPVVSTYDPDGIIERHRLGGYASSVDEIAGAVNELKINSEAWNNMSANSVQYFRERHEVDRAMTAFADYFRDVKQTYYGEAA